MVVWLNGAFGVGKTTTAGKLVAKSDRLRAFDPEWVGYLLRDQLADHVGTDFQQLPSWRRLVPIVGEELARFTGQDLVAVQTVLDEGWWREIAAGFRDRGHGVVHVVLDADPATLRARIEADQAEVRARQWRLEHLEAYAAARGWLTGAADLLLDTGTADAEAAATEIFSSIAPTRSRSAGGE